MDGWSSAFCDWLRRTCSRDDTWLTVRIVYLDSIAGSQDTEFLRKAQIAA